jgi:hypothetical protein
MNAYHDRVLGNRHAGIMAAYEDAKAERPVIGAPRKLPIKTIISMTLRS